MADDIGKILGIFGTIIGIIFFGIFASIILSQLGEQQCQGYKDTISQKDIEINGLKSQINQTNNQLQQCNEEYDRLITENITKKDVEDIKGYFNLTQIQINTINQKFEDINQNYNDFYSIVLNRYRWSITFNFFIGISLLGIEIFSLAFLKSEFVMFIIESIRRKRRKNEHISLPNLN